MVFQEDKIIDVYKFDLHTFIFIGHDKFQTEKGLGLPSGITTDPVSSIPGKVAVRSVATDSWNYVDNDRGRIFYEKQTGAKFETTVLGEKIDRRQFTSIEPPRTEKNELLRFVDERQEWETGLDWYEMPVWNNDQVKSFYTGSFFIPNKDKTNVEPMAGQEGFILDDSGAWIEPPKEEDEDIELTES